MKAIARRYGMSINGETVHSENTLPVINPANEEIVAQVPHAEKEHLNAAVEAAKGAFPAWAALSYDERAAKLVAFADAFLEHRDELAQLFTLEMGRPLKGSVEEIIGASLSCKATASYRLTNEVLEESNNHYVEKVYSPLGVAGLIVPWNFPVMLAIWKIAPALLTGNTIVLKPSPNTPLTALYLGEIAQTIFPKGVFNVVTGGNELGAWMTEHPGINKISFTGSTETGKKVMQGAAANLKRVTLELGGNDAAIVLADADPKEIVQPLFWAAFRNTAQICIATKRLYVHEKIYDQFLDEFVKFAKTVKVGDGMDPETAIGPIQNRMQFEKVNDIINDTQKSGAKMITGETVENKSGYFIPITIVDNPKEDSRVVVEEAFGPILPILKYNDYEDVIEKANNTIYGLAGSVWGKDFEFAKQIASRLETGTVWINQAHNLSPQFPFGGHKQSGIGVEHSIDGLKEYTNSTVIMIKK